MNVADLESVQLKARLGGESGLLIGTGPFVSRICSPFPEVVEGIRQLYGDYPILPAQSFADFQVRVAPPAGIRRWLRPQAIFYSDTLAPFKPLPGKQALALLEWGMNWCISNYAHRYLVIHAAVLEKHGKAVIMPAPPGSGKSTLCAALANRGWRLLSDELALISCESGKISPLVRPVGLKNESIDVIRRFASDAIIGPAVPDTLKGTVAHMRAPTYSVQRMDETANPTWIVFPKYSPGSGCNLESLPRGNTFMELVENAFNYSVLGAEGFRVMRGVVDQSACFRFVYSDLDQAISMFDCLAEK